MCVFPKSNLFFVFYLASFFFCGKQRRKSRLKKSFFFSPFFHLFCMFVICCTYSHSYLKNFYKIYGQKRYLYIFFNVSFSLHITVINFVLCSYFSYINSYISSSKLQNLTALVSPSSVLRYSVSQIKPVLFMEWDNYL